MKIKQLAVLSAALLLAGGCATPHVVTEKQAADNSLSCNALLKEMEEAEKYEEEARKERGVTGTNVASAVFFWPGLVATYLNTEEAIDAARDRQDHLNDLYQEKGC